MSSLPTSFRTLWPLGVCNDVRSSLNRCCDDAEFQAVRVHIDLVRVAKRLKGFLTMKQVGQADRLVSPTLWLFRS